MLSVGAVVAFRRGQAGAHSLVNRSDAPVRYILVSTTNRPDIVEYPDTGATLVVLAEQRLAYPHGADAHQSPSSPKRCGRRPTETPDMAEGAATALPGRAWRTSLVTQGLLPSRTPVP